MGNQMQYRLDRLHGSARAAWDIDDQAAAKRSGKGTAHESERCVCKTFATHLFSKPIQNAFANLPRGLWCYIACSDTRASCCDNQPGKPSLLAQRSGNPGLVIWNRQSAVNDKARLLQAMDDLRPGAVGAKTAKTGVAYSDDSGVHTCDSTLWEPPG